MISEFFKRLNEGRMVGDPDQTQVVRIQPDELDAASMKSLWRRIREMQEITDSPDETEATEEEEKK
jgi:hypothetical protein